MKTSVLAQAKSGVARRGAVLRFCCAQIFRLIVPAWAQRIGGALLVVSQFSHALQDSLQAIAARG